MEIIQSISDVFMVCDELKIKAYIWGGLVQDILEGKILREHGDIDMFLENMDTNIHNLLDKLKIKGYNCSYNENIQMLNIERNNIKTTINPIIFNNNTAIWKHIGNQGFICFPAEYLDTELRKFYDINVLTSGFKFEYCIRKIIKYMNPHWTNNIREKDIKVHTFFERKLQENNINPKELLEKIWGYNPFWLKDGYNGYEAPVLVLGKEYQ